MIGLAIDYVILVGFLIVIAGLWLIYLSVAGTSGLITLFSTRIPIVNGIFFAMLFVVVALFGNMENVPWDNPFSTPVTLLIGIGIYIVCHLIQKTKIGFWLFAVIMSPFWAAVGSVILWLLAHHNWIVFWIAFVALTALNIYLHIRSRRFKLEFSDSSISTQ